MADRSLTTDLVVVWGGAGEQSGAPQQFSVPAQSVAGSRASEASIVRRDEARVRFQQEQAQRFEALKEQFDRKEQVLWEQESAGLRLKDEESEAAHARDQPAESAAEAGPAVLCRKMEHLLEDFNRTKDLFERVTATPEAVPLGVSPPDLPVERGASLPYTPAPSRYTPAPLVLVPRLKVKKPKAWTGSFERIEREAFLKSAGLYLAAHGVQPSAFIGEQETPEIFYNARTLFSSELGVSGISTQMWFNTTIRRRPFHSFSDIVVEVRKHWADDAADVTAFEAFRKAKQGSMPA
ncbi:hypothetical protein JCM9279_006408 [Rhodotorula babjevae]